tara:strand:+ start:96 stop:1133 length:1038 start_codon:yes stop_codon:yes gene_type:complete
MDNNDNNIDIGHNSTNEGIVNKNLKTTKKGFYVDYDKAGLRIDYYNTGFLKRKIRKLLIHLGLFQTLKSIKKNILVKFVYKKKVDQIISKLTEKKLPLFDRISIETFSKCNGGCSFCPVNRFDDPREDQLMKEDLFKKIIVDLYDLNYKGQLILSLNNEPFLDKRIYAFAEMARKYLPEAYISILSNGTPLNVKRFERIIKSVDELVIDNYNDKLAWHENVSEIMDSVSLNQTHKDKVKFRMRLENDVLDTRAGQAKNRDWIKTLKVSCVYPFISMNIQVNGDISLCCNDALSKEVIDNVETKNLEEIWYSKRYFDYREKINKSRTEISICQGCDTVDMPGGIEV